MVQAMPPVLREMSLMVPILTRDVTLVQRTPGWSDWPRAGIPPSGARFEDRPLLRKLVVLVDADALAASRSSATRCPGRYRLRHGH